MLFEFVMAPALPVVTPACSLLLCPSLAPCPPTPPQHSVKNWDATLRKYQLHCLSHYHMPVWTGTEGGANGGRNEREALESCFSRRWVSHRHVFYDSDEDEYIFVAWCQSLFGEKPTEFNGNIYIKKECFLCSFVACSLLSLSKVSKFSHMACWDFWTVHLWITLM